jgi:hypothetical protein
MRRRKRTCRICRDKFYPDYRQRGRQYCCVRPLCQSKRRSRNNRSWYLKNPDCLAYQQDLTRQWFLDHPDYRKRWWTTHPEMTLKNRQDTKRRMKEIRRRGLFEKTNSMFSEVLKNKGDRCFLNTRSGWVHLRLKKQTRYTEYGKLCQDLGHTPRIIRPFGGALYDLGQIVTEKRKRNYG